MSNGNKSSGPNGFALEMKGQGYRSYEIAYKKVKALIMATITFRGIWKNDIVEAEMSGKDFEELKARLSKTGLEDETYTGNYKEFNKKIRELKNEGYIGYDYSREYKGVETVLTLEISGPGKIMQTLQAEYKSAKELKDLSLILKKSKLAGKELDKTKYNNLEDKIEGLGEGYTHYKLYEVPTKENVKTNNATIIFTGKGLEPVQHISSYTAKEELDKFKNILRSSGLNEGLAVDKKMYNLEEKIKLVKKLGYEGYKTSSSAVKGKKSKVLVIRFSAEGKEDVPYTTSYSDLKGLNAILQTLSGNKMTKIEGDARVKTAGSKVAQLDDAVPVNNPELIVKTGGG